MNMAGEGEARKLLGGLGMGCEVPECQPLRGGESTIFVNILETRQRSIVQLFHCTNAPYAVNNFVNHSKGICQL